MDYVQGKRPQPPQIYSYVNFTKQWGSPYGGGWMEWPAGLVNKMSVISNYTRAIQLYDTYSKQKGWVDANPQIFELVTDIWNWRKELGYASWA